MVLPDSHKIPRVPCYLGTPKGRHIFFTYGAITRSGPPFQDSSVKTMLGNFPAVRHDSLSASRYPVLPTRAGLSGRIGLGCCLFAHHYWGNRYCFLFLRVLRCFTSPRCLPQPIDSVEDIPQAGWVVPFGDPRINACLPLPGAYRS
jgi:hypothetical protein